MKGLTHDKNHPPTTQNLSTQCFGLLLIVVAVLLLVHRHSFSVETGVSLLTIRSTRNSPPSVGDVLRLHGVQKRSQGGSDIRMVTSLIAQAG